MVLPVIAAFIGFLTLVMKLLGLILVLNSNGFNSGCLKMTSYLLSDLPIYAFGLYAFFAMIVDLG